MNAEKSWLSGLKPGDTVAYNTGGWSGVHSAMTIDRVTPTQILCGEKRFSRETGCLRGSSNRYSLKPLTAELQEQIEHNALKNWLSSLQYSSAREPLPVETLRAMKAAYDDAQPKEQAK